MKRLVIGTRGSKLALWQANHVADRLRAEHDGLDVDLAIIKTSGDKIQDRRLSEVGGKGLFVKEIEEALIDGRVDVAVHSMKDVPAELPDGLGLTTFLERANPFDALVAPGYDGLAGLPRGGVVGTSSLRRQFQILALRPDLEVVSIRGNVGTRLDKLRRRVDGVCATILAVSGLARLDMEDVITETLSPPKFIPAIGQGTLGLECRLDDAETIALLGCLSDRDSTDIVLAERGVLQRLEGDCHLPIAAYGTRQADGSLSVVARLGTPDGANVIEETLRATGDPAELGFALGERLLEAGGREILDATKGGA